ALATQGQLPEGIARAEEAIRLAERANHTFTLAETLSALGGVYLVRGDLDRAIRAGERGLSLFQEWKVRPWATLARLGYAYALSGRLAEARRVLAGGPQDATNMNSQ